MNNIFSNFRLHHEKEEFTTVIQNIYLNVPFKGTNLWILVFAILIASLGLNVNSPAVIIGAMLISPLMGPILGLGLSMAINDLALLKKSLYNYFFAASVGLAASTIYFLISPLNEAHSEILARVSPNIYDVLIAFFGGCAGSLATSSKLKGNVIPGVAIATALMPPLCTGGYGLATGNWTYCFGALYLFFINTVFIALATLITARFLKFPLVHLQDEKAEKRSRLIIWMVVLITLLPSLYFGYDIVKRDRFQRKAEAFIEKESNITNDYLLKRVVDPKTKNITLVYGGAVITEQQIDSIKMKLPYYGLQDAELIVRQGFGYLAETTNSGSEVDLSLNEKINKIQELQQVIDSVNTQNQLGGQVFKELKTLFPAVNSFLLQQGNTNTDSTRQKQTVGILQIASNMPQADQRRIENWLKLRINDSTVKVYTERR